MGIFVSYNIISYINTILQSIKTESQVASSLRNRFIFTWHDTKTSRPLQMDSMVHNSYDLMYKSLRWMYTIVSHGNSSEIKPLGQCNYIREVYTY